MTFQNINFDDNGVNLASKLNNSFQDLQLQTTNISDNINTITPIVTDLQSQVGSLNTITGELQTTTTNLQTEINNISGANAVYATVAIPQIQYNDLGTQSQILDGATSNDMDPYIISSLNNDTNAYKAFNGQHWITDTLAANSNNGNYLQLDLGSSIILGGITITLSNTNGDSIDYNLSASNNLADWDTLAINAGNHIYYTNNNLVSYRYIRINILTNEIDSIEVNIQSFNIYNSTITVNGIVTAGTNSNTAKDAVTNRTVSTQNNYWASTSPSSDYWQIDFGTQTLIDSMSIVIGLDTDTLNKTATITFSGSNNNSDFTAISTKNILGDSRIQVNNGFIYFKGTFFIIAFSTTQNYRYYRIEISNNTGDSFVLTTIQMQAFQGGFKPVSPTNNDILLAFNYTTNLGTFNGGGTPIPFYYNNGWQSLPYPPQS